jgi:hypothetical protein
MTTLEIVFAGIGLYFLASVVISFGIARWFALDRDDPRGEGSAGSNSDQRREGRDMRQRRP